MEVCMFCFVILHYKTANDTIECVESIKALQSPCQIVIVDNFSDNGSIEIIEDRYGEANNIHILKNSQNLGFASGNNIGYKYARETLHSDFIAVSNNDIIVDSPDFIDYVVNYYFSKQQYHILGPDIESLVDGKHQNPMEDGTLEIKQVSREIRRYQVLYCLSKLRIYDCLKGSREQNGIKKDSFVKEIIPNIQLHGSFMVFSPAFIEKEEFAFRPGTFLYMEESILYKYCQKNGYKCTYNPTVKVYHKEDSSTNSLFKADKGKREFVFKNMIQSLKVYRKVLQGYE